MEIQQLERAFRYNSVDLIDPGPQYTPEQVRDFYSPTYPEILNAAIEGPEEKDNKLVYTFRRAVGTKGALAGSRAEYNGAVHCIYHAAIVYRRFTASDLGQLLETSHGINRATTQSAISRLFLSGLLKNVGKEGRSTVYAVHEDAKDDIAWVNAKRFTSRPNKKEHKREPVHRTDLPGKAECTADLRDWWPKHRNHTRRNWLATTTRTGRRYEKLWPNWTSFVNETFGQLPDGSGLSAANLKDMKVQAPVARSPISKPQQLTASRRAALEIAQLQAKVARLESDIAARRSVLAKLCSIFTGGRNHG